VKSEISDELKNLRQKIDKVDHDILRLLSRRLRLVESIAKQKVALNVPFFQRDRWTEMLIKRIKWASHLKINEDFASKFFRMIHKESLLKQAKFKRKLKTS
jgi:chorismate mutase